MQSKVINTANLLSLSRIIFGIIFLILFFYIINPKIDHKTKLVLEIVSFFIFIISIITDALDGYIARKENSVTNLGKHLDPLTDSIFFIMVFFTFTMIDLMPIYLFIIILTREALMHLFFRPYFKIKGIYLPANIYGKLKMVIQSVFSSIILGLIIIKDVILIYINSYHKFVANYLFLLKTISYVFFFIVVLISLFSLFIYIKTYINTFIKKV